MKKLLLFPLALILLGCKNDYQRGLEEFNSGNYKEAKIFFEKLKVGDENYTEALLKTYYIDSIQYANDFEQQRKDSVEFAERKIKEKELFVTRIKSEISSIDNYKYSVSGELNSLYDEIEFFAELWDLIKTAEDYEEKEVKSLAQTLRLKLEQVQKNTFPKLRKSYGDISNKMLWEENIEVKTLGRDHKTIQFTAGMFADNGNKKEVQNMLSENLNRFRFKRSQYKWYKYDDEYTYYTMNSNDDKAIVFKN
jgi:hypothetical protein